jgi:hypothetical protein
MKKEKLKKIDLVMANAYMDALICGVGIAKVTRLPDGQMELGSVSIDEFFDLSEELRWRAANMQKDGS